MKNKAWYFQVLKFIESICYKVEETKLRWKVLWMKIGIMKNVSGKKKKCTLKILKIRKVHNLFTHYTYTYMCIIGFPFIDKYTYPSIIRKFLWRNKKLKFKLRIWILVNNISSTLWGTHFNHFQLNEIKIFMLYTTSSFAWHSLCVCWNIYLGTKIYLLQ